MGSALQTLRQCLLGLHADGKQDLVTTRSPDWISTRLGNGDGTFQSERSQSGGITGPSVVLARLGSNAYPDLILSDPKSKTTAILHGKGDGTFQSPLMFDRGTLVPVKLAVDLNADGNQDLVVPADSDSALFVLLGKSDGTFQLPQRVALNALANDITAGDFNRDGKQDVACINHEAQAVSVFLGKGDGGFLPSKQSFRAGQNSNIFSVESYYSLVAAADFDGDGHLDVAATGPDGGAAVFGNGDGTFDAVLRYPVGVNAASSVAADMNGDGRMDLVVLNTRPQTRPMEDSAVNVLLSQGGESFLPSIATPLTQYVGNVALGDLDADGKVDAVVTRGENYGLELTASVLGGKGDGHFQTAVDTMLTGAANSLALADVTGDGKADVMAAAADRSAILLLPGRGDGGFAPLQEVPAGYNANRLTSAAPALALSSLPI